MRATWVIAVCLVLLSILFAAPTLMATEVLDAKTIRAGLRTATIEEGKFIERVVAMAEEGTLPPAMVESTFHWASKKPNFRFQYFKRGLIRRAAQAGITL